MVAFENSKQQKLLQLIQEGSIKCMILYFPNPIFIQPSVIERKLSYSCFTTKMYIIHIHERNLKQIKLLNAYSNGDMSINSSK